MAVLFVIALGAGGLILTLFSARRVIKERRRIKEWAELDRLLTQPLNSSGNGLSSLGDAMFISGGAAGLSLLDLYMVADNHHLALANLQHVYNHNLSNMSPMDWAAYFEGKIQAGPESLQGLMSAWKGTLAEAEALSVLNHRPDLTAHGITAHRFDSPNHPDTDIYFTGADGHTLSAQELSPYGLADIQVKSYSDASSFLEQIQHHPNAHYMVNHELYQQLQTDGYLDHLTTSVSDGGWSDAALQAKAESVASNFHEGLDISHHIPVVAALFFGARTINNVSKVQSGQLSTSEAGVNIALDAGRVPACGIAAFGSAKLGALAGSFILPGVGTFVGEVLGAFGGAFGVSRLLEQLKNDIKYGTIMDACERLGIAYCQAVSAGKKWVTDIIATKLIQVSKFKEMQKRESALARAYELPEMFDPDEKPTLVKALLTRSVDMVNRQLLVAEITARNVAHRLAALVHKIDPAVEKKRGYGFLGALVAAQADNLIAIDSGLMSYVTVILQETQRYPHHPYRLQSPGGKDLDTAMLLKTEVRDSWLDAEEHIGGSKPFWQKVSSYTDGSLLIGIFLILMTFISGMILAANNGLFQSIQQPVFPIAVSSTEPILTPTDHIASTPPSAAPVQDVLSAELAFHSDRSCQVFLDGDFIGNTPIASYIVQPGRHTYRMVWPDSTQERTGAIKLAAGKQRDVRVAFPPTILEPGFLTVVTKPWVEIFLDGTKLDNSPVSKIKIQAGKHTLRLVNQEAGIDRTISLKIKPNQHVKFNSDVLQTKQ